MLILKELREQFGLSQNELGKKLETMQSNIGRWENGSVEPTSSNIVKIADFFHITTDELLGRADFATGNITIAGAELTQDEQQLLDNYRRLDTAGKSAFLDMSKVATRSTTAGGVSVNKVN